MARTEPSSNASLRWGLRWLTVCIALAAVPPGTARADDFPDVVCTDLDSLWVFIGDGLGGFPRKEQYFIAADVEPWAVAIGDLTGDGLPEIVSANRFGPNVSFFRNLGGGEFDTQPRIIETPERPYDVDLGDLTGDGSLEIVVTCNYDPGMVRILINDGAGEFYDDISIQAGGTCFNSALADLDGTNGLDLIVVRNGADDVATYLNDGTGVMSFHDRVAAGDDPKAVQAANFNGDSLLDVAVTNDAAGRFTVFLGDGKGGLTLKESYASGVNPRELAAVDLDADGARDLLIVGGRNTDYISRFLGNGDGTFGNRLDYPTGPRPNSVDAADFDRDGIPDAAVANWSLDDPSQASMTILYGNGDGGFSSQLDFVPPGGFRKIVALAAGQLNPTTFVRSDCSGDGIINITDPILGLSYMFQEGKLACLDAADVDDNGALEITDAIRSLSWIFLDGPPPMPPFPVWGVDPTPDLLGCGG